MGWKLPAYLTIKALLTTKMNFFSPHTAITQLTNIPWQFLRPKWSGVLLPILSLVWRKKRFTYYFKVGYSVPNYTIIVSISFSSLKEGVKEFSDFFLPSSFQEIPDLYYYNRATRRPDLQLFVCLCLLKNRYFVVACLFVWEESSTQKSIDWLWVRTFKDSDSQKCYRRSEVGAPTPPPSELRGVLSELR